MEYYVYVLRCHGDVLYTGITSDLAKRMREHVLALPTGAKFTRAHKPEGLVGLWTTENKSLALKLEYRIKSLKRSEKLELLAAPDKVDEIFPEGVVPCEIADLTKLVEKEK